ncbi:MAG TPA: SAM-dependent chlorinase/fluorinase [Pirellulaceae bacterium]|nr:SAM-dependent chlorinase/fluorinase [Pirellulaceae bacterium]HMO93957.1 SAM-dependent chlorinase/fluorinase [Pirellulaceae bacterium]HMP67963.1 SAM-dependent chlorinase/fluorinase [Pirellulaceae bacterium]
MSIITLTTDFGEGSRFVGEMKGVILGINPHVTLIDLTHSIEPQSIFQATFVLTQSVGAFPPETIHIVVVDPGVGMDRKLLLAEIGDWTFVCPDNGILTLLLDRYPLKTLCSLDQRRFWRSAISNTFHGRDILAPVAAHFSLKQFDPAEFGSRIEECVRIPVPKPTSNDGELRGQVISIDSFGNLITNIERCQLAERRIDAVQVRLGFHRINGLVRTYGERGTRQLVAYFGSSELLEIAVVNDSAQQKLAARVGDPVVITL